MPVMFAEEISGAYELGRIPLPGPPGVDHEIIVARLVALFDAVAAERGSMGRIANMMSIAVLELRRRSQATDSRRLRVWQKDALFRSLIAAYKRLSTGTGGRFSDEGLRLAVTHCISLVRHWALSDASRAIRTESLRDMNDIALSFQINLLDIAILDDICERLKSRIAEQAKSINSLLVPVDDLRSADVEERRDAHL